MLLKDLFFQPEKVRSNPEMIDELAEGMLRQTGHKWDNKFVDDITNHLFEVNGKGGLDLIDLNTQRGRDHGLPGVETSSSRFPLHHKNNCTRHDYLLCLPGTQTT